jgi:hypothetical protein
LRIASPSARTRFNKKTLQKIDIPQLIYTPFQWIFEALTVSLDFDRATASKTAFSFAHEQWPVYT